MGEISETYRQCKRLLDQLGSELWAAHRHQAAGHYVDGARQAIVEGLEIVLRLVMHQIDTLDLYDRSTQGIDLADPALHQDADPVATARYLAERDAERE